MKTLSTGYSKVIWFDFQVLPLKYFMPMSSVEELRKVLGKAFTGIQANLPFDGLEQYQLSFSTPFQSEARIITEYFQFLEDRLHNTTPFNCRMKIIRRGNTEIELGNVWIDEIATDKDSFQVPGYSNMPSTSDLFNINLIVSCTLTNLEL